MTPDELQQALSDRGAILSGHFQLASGRHSDTYIEKFRILQWPDITSGLCEGIAGAFAGQASHVAGPTTGGVILSFEVAKQLGLPGIFAERREDGPGREFRRGFQLGAGDRVLVVDDILTTGGSIRDVLDAVRGVGAEPVGVGVLVDRSGGAVDFGVPLFACLEVQIQTYERGSCPMCKEGRELIVT